MYRKYTLDQLLQTKTSFFQNLSKILYRKRYETLKQYLKDMIKEWNHVYFFNRSNPTFSIKYEWWSSFVFYDEREKIQLPLQWESLSKLHSLLKDTRKIKKHATSAQKIDKMLQEWFKSWKHFGHINNKPYLVYDIETTLATQDLSQTKFYLAYAYIVLEPWKWVYKYIWPEAIDAFVDYMLAFDGYIVWFNNIRFDNPVSVYNTNAPSNEKIQALNAKSIDLFLFLRNLTWRRLGLNRVASALVWVEKTLSSWAEWDVLMQKYYETWDESFLKEFKAYCKNDVQMTVLVLFYFMYKKSVHLDDEDYEYTLDEFVSLSQKQRWETNKYEDEDGWMFS